MSVAMGKRSPWLFAVAAEICKFGIVNRYIAELVCGLPGIACSKRLYPSKEVLE